MKQLDNSILLLQKSPFHAVKVEYADNFGNFNAIENNATEASLITKYGSIKDFFEGLNAKGVKLIRVTDRTKNGSSFKTIGQSYEVKFENGSTAETTVPAVQIQPTHQAVPMQNQGNGLNGLLAGLGLAELNKIHDYARLKEELTEYKIDNSVLKKENENLKEINLRNEILGVKKLEQTEASAKLLGVGTQYMPLLQSILAGMKGQPPMGEIGLRNPAMSPLQNQFLQFVQNADDAYLQDLNAVITGMQNDSFDTELTELLKKFNLIAA